MPKKLLPERWLSRLFLLACLCAGLVVQGCDTLTSENDTSTDDALEDPLAASARGKFRNSYLIDRAIRYKGGAKTGEGQLNLIFAVQPNRVLDRYKVLDRFKILDRFKVLDRFEFSHAFPGFAISIEDSLGENDFSIVINELMKDPDIAWFEPDFTVELPVADILDSHSGQIIPWSVTAVGGEESWAASGDGDGHVENVEVYVLDTGVAQGQENNNDDLVTGEHIDFRNLQDQHARDNDGHGTHIAGIIGAYDNTHGVAGIAPGVKIHNYKVLNDEGGTDVSVTIAAVEHIIARKQANPGQAMVVNMSLGEDLQANTVTALDLVVEAAVQEGITIVVAAGNHGGPVEHVTPAHVPGVITVGSYGLEKKFSGFSAYGPLVDILAPGEEIISLSPSDNGMNSGKPVSLTGTSMATGHVTGAAVLYLSQNPTATPDEVLQAILAKSKTNITGAPNGTTNRSLWIGMDTDAFEVTDGAVFGLMNKYSSKCLDVANGAQDNGANVYQWNCHWKGNQTWKVIEAGNDYYNLQVSHSGKQLDASTDTNEYNNAIQWTGHSGNNQQWEFVESGDGYVFVKSRNDGGCLEIEGNSKGNGKNVRVATCTGAENQQWKLVSKDWTTE